MSKILVPFILILGLLVGVYLVSQTTSLFSKADVSTAPSEIKVSNISDNSFTVSWLTGKLTTGFIKYGSEALEETMQDDRDLGSQELRVTHHVTIKNLEPGKTYYYKIFSGPEVFDNQGKPFTQVTASTTENPPAMPEPVFGTVVKQEGGVPAEALVYLQINNGSRLSGYTREGRWLITLNNARTKDLLDYISVEETDLINLEIKSGLEFRTKVSARVKEKEAFSKIVLAAPEIPDGKIKDLNGDGVINAIDYILQFLLPRKFN